MSDLYRQAMCQALLGTPGSGSSELESLIAEVCRRIVLSGINFSSSGVLSLGIPSFGPSVIANLGVGVIGDVPYFDSTATLARLADIATGNVLLSGGVGAVPAYGKVTDSQIAAAGLSNAAIAAAAAIAYSKLNLALGIVNADVNAAAAIAWTKLDKTGSSLADLTTKSAGALTSGTLDAARATTPLTSTSTGTVNDFNPGTLSGPIVMLRCNNAALLTIQGIVAGVDGQILILESIGAGQVDFAHQNAGSTAANRLINFATSGLTSLAAGSGTAAFQYDATTARWRMIAHEQGAWITPTFAAGDYVGDGTITWTVAAGDVTTCAYKLRGREMTVSVFLVTTTTGGAASTSLKRAIPGGFTAPKTMGGGMLRISDAGAARTVGHAFVLAAATAISYTKIDFSNWSNAAADTTEILGSVSFEVT